MSSRSSRGVAPVVGVVVLVAVTVLLAAVVGAFAIGRGSGADDVPTSAVVAEQTRGKYGNPKVVLTLVEGDELDVRDLTVRVFVDGTPLEHQLEVPFFAETGFNSGPDGPFNSNTADKHWNVGEETSFTIAGSNSPQPTTGSTVAVRIYSNGKAVTTARV